MSLQTLASTSRLHQMSVYRDQRSAESEGKSRDMSHTSGRPRELRRSAPPNSGMAHFNVRPRTCKVPSYIKLFLTRLKEVVREKFRACSGDENTESSPFSPLGSHSPTSHVLRAAGPPSGISRFLHFCSDPALGRERSHICLVASSLFQSSNVRFENVV